MQWRDSATRGTNRGPQVKEPFLSPRNDNLKWTARNNGDPRNYRSNNFTYWLRVSKQMFENEEINQRHITLKCLLEQAY